MLFGRSQRRFGYLSDGQCVSSIEIKLVALPDNPTCNLSEDKFGSEIVVRPDTIIYLACSFIQSYEDNPEALRSRDADVDYQRLADARKGYHRL